MRMTLKVFCERYGFSYRGMQDRAAKGEFPHSGGGKQGSLIYVFDDTLLEFFRRQDEENAKKKAALAKPELKAPTAHKRIIPAADDDWGQTLRAGIAERKATQAAAQVV